MGCNGALIHKNRVRGPDWWFYLPIFPYFHSICSLEEKVVKFVLCPRCELNYMPSRDKLCKICQQELQSVGRDEEEVELCSICNENPVVPGHDVCLMCLREMGSNGRSDSSDAEDGIHDDSLGSMDSVSGMDEIIPDLEQDDLDEGFAEMGDALSLERVREDEENEQDAEDQEDEEK